MKFSFAFVKEFFSKNNKKKPEMEKIDQNITEEELSSLKEG